MAVRSILSPSARCAAPEPYLEGNRALTGRFGPEHAAWFTALPQDDDKWFAPAPITPDESRAVQRAAVAYQMRRKGRVAGTANAALALSRLWFAGMREPNISLPFAPLEPPLRQSVAHQ